MLSQLWNSLEQLHEACNLAHVSYTLTYEEPARNFRLELTGAGRTLEYVWHYNESVHHAVSRALSVLGDRRLEGVEEDDA
jgi:hypothetical protein